MLIPVVAGGAFVLSGALWLLLPSLEADQRAVEAQAAIHIERARRLLHGHSFGLRHKSILLDQLLETDVDMDIEDPAALVDTSADEYQRQHEALWAAYQPTDWEADPPRAIRANYGNLQQQIREGVRLRARLVDQNHAVFDDALRAVEEALSITRGEVSSRSNSEANRLKGVILYYQGLAEWMRATAKRREAEPHRRALAARAIEAKEFETARTMVAASGIEERSRELADRAAQAALALAELRQRLASLDRTIDDLASRQEAAVSRRDAARTAMEDLISAGIDFSDPAGGQTFQRKLFEQDTIYRQASREDQSLAVGFYPNARIDRSGDPLTGRYVEDGRADNLTIEHGLTYYRNEKAVAAVRLAKAEQALEGLRSDQERLDDMKNSFEQDEARARRRRNDAIAAARASYADLSRVESEAFVVEETALEHLEQARKASQRAATAAREWTRAAQSRVQALSPEAKNRSADNQRAQARWMGGFNTAQVATARFAKAWVHYDRYRSATQNAKLFARIAEPLQLREADATAEQAKAADAHDAGVQQITEAMQELEKAHGETGGHWTLVAQEAGGMVLMSLFGHPAYVDDAIETYRSALQGRENEVYAQKFVTRLKRLERR